MKIVLKKFLDDKFGFRKQKYPSMQIFIENGFISKIKFWYKKIIYLFLNNGGNRVN